MALTSAEKQARYRQRMMRDRKGPLMVRLQVLVDPGTSVKTRRIAKRTGWTQREIIEEAIALLDRSTAGRKIDYAFLKQK